MLPKITFFVCFILSIQARKLHERMTKEEIQSVFKCKHDEIHKIDYQVVPIYHKSNNESTIHLRAFGQNYTLYLEKNNHILLGSKTPIFIAKEDGLKKNLRLSSSTIKIRYSRIQYPLPENFDLFHDVENNAALTTHKDTGNQLHINGIIGSDVIIQHIPNEIHKKIVDDLSSYDPFSDDPYSYDPFLDGYDLATHHIVIKPTIESNFPYKTFENNEDNELNFTEEYGEDSESENALDDEDNTIVYPEILITIDYDTYKIHGSNIKSVAKYMAAFWNAVDLRFRRINNPKIRLNIAGLIIPTAPGTPSYMERNVVNEKFLMAQRTISDIGEYFANETQFPYDTYDVLVAMSGKQLRFMQHKLSVDYMTGLANVNATCLTKFGYSIALVKDTGGFNGITTAAHELAHVFGAPHDGEDSAKIPGGPCSWDDGYLMSYKRHTKSGVQWSECSITAMRMSLNSVLAKCLKNKPDIGIPYPKILPGRLLSRDEQCLRSLGYKADKSKEDDCAILWCLSNDTSISENRPPAEGSNCGKGKICLDAECLDDPEY